ncbi:MAG: lipid A biosynthesis acyltransferase [Bacteroidetes bacterium]|nr:lipid A biosynthesis acyltransferase [Bacteroidota bacterium]
MSSWKGKTRGGVAGYAIFIFTIKRFGTVPAYVLLYFVALYYWFFSRKKYLRYYFRERLGYSAFRSMMAIYRLYYNFGQVLIDKVVVLGGLKKRFTFDFDGEHYIEGMKDGGMLIGAHMGNWEIASQLLQRLPLKIYIVMYDEEHRKIKDLLDNVLKEKTFEIIPLKNDLSHIIAIHNALQTRGLVVMHGDRFMKGSRSIDVSFLGAVASFPAGPFQIALKSGFPVSFVYAMKESWKHYHFFASKPKVYSRQKTEGKHDSAKIILEDYVKCLEEKVKAYPEHWFNFHDFWGIDA